MSARQQAGKAAHARLRAALGDQGYREYQRAVGRAGGRARQAQLQATLGAEGNAHYQHTLYQAAVARHGTERMRSVLTRAHEARRRWRVANPTPAEALLQWLALEAGFTLHADLSERPAWATDPHAAPRWRPNDAVVEARVLNYACDLLLPSHGVALEVEGGIHCITAERDAFRRAALARVGITVRAIPNAELFALSASALFGPYLENHHA